MSRLSRNDRDHFAQILDLLLRAVKEAAREGAAEAIRDLVGNQAVALSRDTYLDVNGLAAHAKASPSTVRRWVKRGLPHMQDGPGGRLRFRREEVEAWLEVEQGRKTTTVALAEGKSP